MRCLNFLEEKLYLWSSRKKNCFGNSFSKCCRSLSSERSFRNIFFLPFPFFLTFIFFLILFQRNLVVSSILSLVSWRGGREGQRRFIWNQVSLSGIDEITCFLPSLLKSLSFEARVYELGTFMREFIIIFHQVSTFIGHPERRGFQAWPPDVSMCWQHPQILQEKP